MKVSVPPFSETVKVALESINPFVSLSDSFAVTSLSVIPGDEHLIMAEPFVRSKSSAAASVTVW